VEKERSSQKSGWRAFFFLGRGIFFSVFAIGFVSGIFAVDDPPDFYKTLLTEAEYYYFQKRPEISREKLNKIKVEYSKHLELGYFRLSGKLYEDAGREPEAIEEYERALRIQKEDSELAKKLYFFHLKDRRIRKAFDYLRIYLYLKPEDLSLRYKSLILASRLGERKYFQYAARLIESNAPKKQEPERLEALRKEKKYAEGLSLSKEMVEIYPFEKKFHEYLRIFQYHLSPDSDQMEEILLDTAAIFFQEKKYSLDLAQFYTKKKRIHAALNLYRRMFSQGLASEGWDLEEEILFLIRNTYFQLGWKEQAKDISFLVDMVRKAEHLTEQEIETKYLLNKNREILVYAIYFLEKNKSKSVDFYKERLYNRDQKLGDKEFMNVFPVFDYEVNTEMNQSR
jgi:hypothetical protein